MKTLKFKLFAKPTQSLKIAAVPYVNTNRSYTSFLKEQHALGYRQIIITSDMMISLLQKTMNQFTMNIEQITFMESDKDLEENTKNLIELANEAPEKLKSLISYLSIISDQQSIDIKQIYMNGYLPDKQGVRIFLQSNGIIGISDTAIDVIRPFILSCIEEYWDS